MTTAQDGELTQAQLMEKATAGLSPLVMAKNNENFMLLSQNAKLLNLHHNSITTNNNEVGGGGNSIT